MWRDVWGNLRRMAVGGSAALLLATSAARADDADTLKVIQELKARMEQMEKQNQQLQNQLQNMQQRGGSESSEQADEGKAPPAGTLTEDSVKRMIGDYMKEDAAAKKAADDAKKNDFSEVVNNTPMTAVFDNGVLWTSANKAFTMRVGTEVQFDAVWLNAPFNVQYGNPALNSISAGKNGVRNGGGIGPVQDGINTRRMRIDLRGQMFENFQYMVQWDWGLAQATPDTINSTSTAQTSSTLSTAFGVMNPNVFNVPMPIECWGMFTDLPLVRNIRIGNQKPLWSFENWNSSRFQNFMERSLSWDAFVEDQNNGFIPSIDMLNWSENERFTWQAGIAKNNRNVYFWHEQNGGDMVMNRFSFLPWYCDNGRYLMHLGCGGMFADASNDPAASQAFGIDRFRARTLLRNTNNVQQAILTEARMNANNEWRVVPEFYMNLGSFNIQAEYYLAGAGGVKTISTYGLPARNIGNWQGWGYYAQAGYYLTGEYNPYNKQLGRLERVIPHSNFFTVRNKLQNMFGSGLWWTGFRYSFLDLNGDGGVNGAGVAANGAQASSANVWDCTYSIMWCPNPNVRILGNAIYENRNPGNTPQSSGPVRGLGMRLQIDF